VQAALRERHGFVDTAQLGGGGIAFALDLLLLGRQGLDLRARRGKLLLRRRLATRGLRWRRSAAR
jgi:hypothetical protein